jgi:hypothetical protein
MYVLITLIIRTNNTEYYNIQTNKRMNERMELNKMYMRYIAFQFLLLSVCGLLLSNYKETSKVVTIFKPHKKGDVVGEFTLENKLDFLGVTRYYSVDDIFADSPSISFENSPYILEDNIHNRIALLENVHINTSSEYVKEGLFYLNEKIFLGGHGELWRARRLIDHNQLNMEEFYILKRMYAKDRAHMLRCAHREVYFGKLLNNTSYFTKLITNFQIGDDYWLVFRDEGISLQQLLYAVTLNNNMAVFESSFVWKKLRTTENGKETLKAIIQKIIYGMYVLNVVIDIFLLLLIFVQLSFMYIFRCGRVALNEHFT